MLVERWINGQTIAEWIHERMDKGWTDGWMNGQMDERKNGQMDTWME